MKDINVIIKRSIETNLEFSQIYFILVGDYASFTFKDFEVLKSIGADNEMLTELMKLISKGE